MMHANAFKHVGCIGENCPHCPRIDQPGYEAVRANLIGDPKQREPNHSPRRPLKCVHRGDPTGNTIVCSDCPGAVRIKVLGCALHGRCTARVPAAGVACCATCAEYDSGSLTINQGAGGLGDALMGACAIAGARRLHPPERAIVYKVRDDNIAFLDLFDFGGQVLFDVHDWDDGNERPAGDPHPGDLQMNIGYRQELQTKGKFSRLARNCRNIGGVTPAMPQLRDRAGLLAQGADFAGAVLLSPFSTWATREYPLRSWLTVERMLREEGYRVVVLDAHCKHDQNYRQGRHEAMKSEKLFDAAAARVTGAVLNAACVVSNDSGIAHLAGIVGAKTVVLCGQVTGPEIYGFYDRHHGNMTYLDGHLDCRGCWWQEPFNASCQPTCPNIATITPSEIVATIKRIVGPPPPPYYLGETSKAHARRQREGWYAEHVAAPAIDIGCWIDYLQPGFPCRRFDQMYGDGDATTMVSVPDASYQTVYASHVLEHVVDPVAALRSWWRILRPGGKLIVCVPHRDLYEGKLDLPSRWNGDHKTFWLPDAPAADDPPHTRGLRQVLKAAIPQGELVSLRILDEGHHYPDKSIHPQGEFSIEAIVRKPG